MLSVVGVASGFYILNPVNYTVVIFMIPLAKTISSHFSLLAASLTVDRSTEAKQIKIKKIKLKLTASKKVAPTRDAAATTPHSPPHGVVSLE